MGKLTSFCQSATPQPVPRPGNRVIVALLGPFKSTSKQEKMVKTPANTKGTTPVTTGGRSSARPRSADAATKATASTPRSVKFDRFGDQDHGNDDDGSEDGLEMKGPRPMLDDEEVDELTMLDGVDPSTVPLPSTPKKAPAGADFQTPATKGDVSSKTAESPYSNDSHMITPKKSRGGRRINEDTDDEDDADDYAGRDYADPCDDLAAQVRRSYHHEDDDGAQQINLTHHISQSKLSKFNGTRNRSERSLRWLKTFIYGMEGTNTPQDRWCEPFQLCMEGGASNWIRQLPKKTRSKWSRLYGAFMAYYCSQYDQSAEDRYYTAKWDEEYYSTIPVAMRLATSTLAALALFVATSNGLDLVTQTEVGLESQAGQVGQVSPYSQAGEVSPNQAEQVQQNEASRAQDDSTDQSEQVQQDGASAEDSPNQADLMQQNDANQTDSPNQADQTQENDTSQADSPNQADQTQQDGTCTLIGTYVNGTDVSRCSNIVIDSLTVPPGVMLDLTNVTDGAKIKFQGTTTFGQKVSVNNEHICDYLLRLNGHARSAKIMYETGGPAGARHAKRFLDTCEDNALVRQLIPQRFDNIAKVEAVINDTMASDRRRKDRGNSSRKPSREGGRRNDSGRRDDRRGDSRGRREDRYSRQVTVAEASVDELYDAWQSRLAITPRRRAVSDSGSDYSDRSCKSECESDGDYVDTAETGRSNIGGRTDGQNRPHGLMGDGRRDEAHRPRWGDQDRRARPEYGPCVACGAPRHSVHRCFRRCKFCIQVHRDGQCEHYKLYEDTVKFVKSKHDKDSLPSELQGIYSSNLNERARQLLDKKVDIQGIAKDNGYTQQRAKVKLTLGWELVYEFEVWITPHYTAVNVILGTVFMIPAGVRFDPFRSTIKNPEEVVVPLIKSQREVDKQSSAKHVPGSPNDALDVPPGSVIKFKLQRNIPSRITHDLWDRRTNRLVATVRFDRSERPSRVKVTNVSNRRMWCPAHFIFVWWVPNDDLPLDDGYVQMHTRKYRDWKVLAFAAATDGQLSDKERLLYEEWFAQQPPAVERRQYAAPGGVRPRPLGAPHGPTCEEQWKQLDEGTGTDDGTKKRGDR
ncbi:unnamed protein product [Phytophthora fragariaefolia]|uniref:Unnamed protein product n=1 Tax=Phytophthora fragariaefolia TaxID=1490495 RepID=A0A9W6U4C3_9STRA|nr:unnamed protein product [Phytophthora fragariaefolia]